MLLRAFAWLALWLSAAPAIAQQPAPPRPAATVFENVRVFDGVADRLSAPTNVLVLGDTIRTISAAPIADPPGADVTRIPAAGAR